MKFTGLLLISTALVTTPFAYSANITTSGSTLIVNSGENITVTSNDVTSGANNAINITGGLTGIVIENNGEISTSLIQSAVTGLASDPIPNNANAITAYDENIPAGSEVTFVNTGKITTQYNVSADTSNTLIDAMVSAPSTGNGVFNVYGTARNEGVIVTDVTATGGNAYSGTNNLSSNADAQADSSGNGIFYLDYSNPATNIKVDANTGLIQTNLSLTSGIANSNVTTTTTAANTSAGAGAYAYNSGNGIMSDLVVNQGIIQTNVDVTGGEAHAVATSSVSRAGASAYIYTEVFTSANGVYGDIDANNGIIAANLDITGGAVSNQVNSTSTTYSGLDAYITTDSSGNGVYGDMGINNGRIGASVNLTAGKYSHQGAAYKDNGYYATGLGNGIYGNISENLGTITSNLEIGLADGVTVSSGWDYIEYSGNGVVLTDSSTETMMNTGSIIASNNAIAATTARNVDNYGTFVGTSIYNSNITANNYGTYILIDENGNILSIEQGTSATDAYGRTSEQAAMVGSTDSYNIYTSQTAISDKIINGAGVASGVVTLQGTDDFTITNSAFNAYHTALELQTTHRVDVSDTYFNGGGLKNIMGLSSTNGLASANPTSEYAVIVGNEQDNFLLVHGNSFINGDVAFGDGADIFVLDTENTTLNGTTDLGASDDDTFALYTFNGTSAELTIATEDYASWGMFNEYLGDKVLNFENIGAEAGTITMIDNLTDYGLYVGTQATADFTTIDEYALKNLRNDGLVNLSDDAVGGHITVGDYLKGEGTYMFDSNFNNLQSDYITVKGQVTANGIIAINGIETGESAQVVNGEILLIKAPNDSNKSDEDFNLATVHHYNGESKIGRFTGTPFVWALKTLGNDWVLTYVTDPRYPETDPTDPTTPINPHIKPLIVAEIPAYASLPTIGREIVMDELGTLHTRLGELRNNQGWVGTGDSNLKTNLGSAWHNGIGFDDSQANAWLKGTISHFDISSNNSFDVSGTYGGFNLGIDKKFDLGNHSPDWSVFTGLFGGYKTGSFETSGKGNQYTSNEHADIDIDAWSIGGYATFFNTAGTYIDLVAEYMDFSADIDAAGLNSSTDGYALAGSIEVGHSFDLAKDWIIEPQAQVKLAHINWDNFNDGVNDVSFEDHTYVTGRAGVRVEKTITTSIGEIKPWAYVGVLHEFTDAPEVTYADTIFEAVDYNTAGEIKLGITADVYQSVQMYADIGYATDFSDYDSIKGDLGLRITW